jgi:hypothetical protein
MVTSIRKHMLTVLKQDLVGPRVPDEQFPELPTVRYLTGILYPAGTPADELEDDESPGIGEIEEDEEPDEPNPRRQAIRQSSIGLTCELTGGTAYVGVTYARYSKTLVDGQGLWARTPFESAERPINLSVPGVHTYALDGAGAELQVHVRPAGVHRIITVFLTNRAEPSEPVKDADCIFQPEIRVRGNIVAKKVFQSGSVSDSDTLSFQLLYRNHPEFAVGHGCAVDWDATGTDQAREVWTTLIPATELSQVRHYDRDDLDGLNMMVLARCADGTEVMDNLGPIVSDYVDWIREREVAAGTLNPALQETALRHIAACDEAAGRIRDGLNLLASDTRILDAFRFMNEVMAYQRARTEYAKAYKTHGRWPAKTAEPTGRWRPFQIAFILMNLRSIVDPTHPERTYADLLWFATGGGKTEAYLGLAAFVLAFRRLRGRERIRDHAGVTVLMRYTLRLLTVQQYQRATTMICACEHLRKMNPSKWGTEPFLIGLWVGRNSTPNNHDDARESLAALLQGTDVKEANPVQLHNCPWCGKELGPADYHIDSRRDWMLIHCPNAACDFFGGQDDPDTAIPALTVDDDIYHRCPSLLIGTVDKFARLPWNAKTAALFGLVDRWCPRHGFLTPAEDNHPVNHRANRGLPATAVQSSPRLQPPELIIQDELHLISGPLGTMVGHFETAVDFLCTLHGGRSPKVIASTATIRRASEQVKQLFNREVRQFPPPGLDASDSFFARHVAGPNTPGRQYVGVCATGRSGKNVMFRVFAALLQAAQELRIAGTDPKLLDPYWTLTSYFNSLKELGAAVRLIEDDVPKHLEVVASAQANIRSLDRVQELNSRRDATEIPAILAQMEQELGSGKALDILLATNMISVGVDVDRLGLMVVQGQPKGTSEYIQATSRVGRKYPGLIVTMYNWARPRDLSHYERFRSYHEMMYRYVEPTSVTPFSPRARDRALPAVLIGMARLIDRNLARNKDASHLAPGSATMEAVIKAIGRRVEALEPSESEELRAELRKALAKWQSMARRFDDELRFNRGYYEAEEDAKHILMRRVGEENNEAWLVPDSLRDVEEEARLYYATPRGGTTGG